MTIGFLGGLSGRVADLGTAGRDGALLALEEQNAAGGIHGRPLILKTGDDQQTPQRAISEFNRLADEGCQVVIGPMTSAMAIVVAPEADRRRVPVVGPTISTDLLSDQKDYFLRLYPASAHAAGELARYASEIMGLKRLVTLLDYGNRAHTQNWADEFEKVFVKSGGSRLIRFPYTSSKDTQFTVLAERMAREDSDGVFILANAVDTALVLQALRNRGYSEPAVTTEWSATEDILRFGGKAADGMTLMRTFHRSYPGERYQRFRRKFSERFGYEAGFASVQGYDSMQWVLAALARNANPEQLPRTMVNMMSHEGLQGIITMNEFGDVQRKHFPVTIKDGRFVSLAP